MTAQQAFVGAAVERVEDLRLLTGNGRYVDDVHLDGMLHLAVVRSSAAHGLIKAIDIAEAQGMPGVHAVYTGQDIAGQHNGKVPKIPMRVIRIPALARFEQYVIAVDKVRYVGEPLAIVIADSAAQAEDAADRIYADIESLPPVTSWQAAASAASVLFETIGTNVAITHTAAKGAAKTADGPYVRREKFSVQRHSAFPIENRGLVAQWDASRSKMTVFGAAKVPFFIRSALAAAMELPAESVDMIELDVGGSFGVRGEFYPEDFLVPFSSRMLKRPVKWIEDRRENLLGTNHSREMDCEMEIVCELDGRIRALRGTVSVDAGAYMRSTGAIPARLAAMLFSGPYDVPHIHLESTVYMTNKAPIGTYRGPGVFEADFFRERLFDIAARELGIDPVEFRRINLVKASQMPFPLAQLTHPDEADELDSGDYQITLERCLAEFGWKEKRALQGRLIHGKYHGIAIACFVDGGAGGIKEHAAIEIEEDGHITVSVGSASVGQGLATILTQIAADALAVPMERIRIRHGSTTNLKEGVGTGYSRSTVIGGSAVLTVAAALKQKIKEAAAAQWGCAARDVRLAPGLTASFGTATLTPLQLGRMKLRVDGEYSTHHRTYAYGAAAAHVMVDPGTGKVDLVDYITVEDVGRIINPLTIHGQAIGAIVQGLGGVFLEKLVYDEHGQFLSGTLADYLMPTAADFPHIRAVTLENSPAPNNPLGAKGAGEGGIVPVGAVMANAVAAALSSLDVQPNTLPLTPPVVWALIDGAGRQA